MIAAGWQRLKGLAHIGFDRAFGYGFKSSDSFHNTHLGLIGKARAH